MKLSMNSRTVVDICIAVAVICLGVILVAWRGLPSAASALITAGLIVILFGLRRFSA